MINIAEVLDKCNKGTKLYSPIFGDVYLEKIRPHLAVIVNINKDEKNLEKFLYDGRYTLNGECMLFPSKENRDWNTFQRPFQDGDVISNNSYIAIFHKLGKPNFCEYDKVVYYHCYLRGSGYLKARKDCGVGYISDFRFASESEKQKLLNAIKENGYKWNPETKTLEKLIEPKFKSGDKIVKKNDPTECWYVQGNIDSYCGSYHYNIVTKSKFANLYLKDQDDWELAPTPKFKVGDIVKTSNTMFEYMIIKITDTHYTLESIPGKNTYDILICEDENWKLASNKFDISTLKAFDKVLVRDSNESRWCADMFSHYSGHDRYPFCTLGSSVSGFSQCIPYEGNEHLLGTTNDCGEYYKNW